MIKFKQTMTRVTVMGAAVLLALVLALPALAESKTSLPSASFADLVEQVSPAVVNIRIVKTVKGSPMMKFFQGQPGGRGQNNPFPDEFFERFFGRPGPKGESKEFKQRSLGSGVIIDAKGYLITNNHVVDKADEIVVRFKGGKELPAKVIGRDAKTDLALIKVEAQDDLPYLPLGDSAKLRVGDWVLAVGNPFGLENTVTAGIISAKGRIIGAGPYDDFLQTDASINPGNSGGPLINLRGEVVGINTAITAQGQGIGFAIPVNMVKKIAAQLRDKGKVVRGYLGIYFQPVTPELAEQLDMKKPVGALVAQVIKGSPADKAGLKNGDVIIEYDGKDVENWHDLPALVADTPVGKDVEVVVIRDGDEKELEVHIGEMNETAAQPTERQKEAEEKLGMTLQQVTPELAEQFGLDKPQGLVVSGVREGSPAAEAGLKSGDVIIEANRKPVDSIETFKNMIDELEPGDGMMVYYQRGNRRNYTVIKLPKG